MLAERKHYATNYNTEAMNFKILITIPISNISSGEETRIKKINKSVVNIVLTV